MKKPAYCFLSHVPVRERPDDRAEMINELIYGEEVQILERVGSWLKIASLLDGYTGYVDHLQIAPTITSENAEKEFLTDSIRYSSRLDQFLSFGSILSSNLFEEEKTSHVVGTMTFSEDLLIECSRKWLNTPYVWGGKSTFGTDCSGFVQSIYRAFDILLPRDASQQATKGILVRFENRKVGDLAFFSKDGKKVHHVGIVLPEGMIVHASSFVKIDHLRESGIHRTSDNELSHRLHSIKRITKQ